MQNMRAELDLVRAANLAARAQIDLSDRSIARITQALRELSETVPDDITVNIDEFMVNDEMLRLRGTTDSFGSVDRIEAAILANPLFPGAKKSDVNKARDSKMRFMVTIPREPEEEEVGG